MAKLILKSPYIKSTGGASGYLKYIATRERVEIIPDDRPPTRKQEQLITKLVKDFPEVKEMAGRVHGRYASSHHPERLSPLSGTPCQTLALQNDVDVKTVNSMLGHYDAGFTLRTHTHATRQMQDEAAQTMGNFMAQAM